MYCNALILLLYVVCANASYLNYSYGISVTVTFNNFTILNETVSGNIWLWIIEYVKNFLWNYILTKVCIFIAQDPPPICIGEEIIQQIEAEICLRILDVHINSNKFHACFQILVKLMKFKVFSINLGCIDTKIQNKLTSIKNNTFNLLEVLYKKKTDFESPSVIRV